MVNSAQGYLLEFQDKHSQRLSVAHYLNQHSTVLRLALNFTMHTAGNELVSFYYHNVFTATVVLYRHLLTVTAGLS